MGTSANSRLAKGTMVYMIGNLLSKVLQMLILPVITAALATSEYGYYDLVITTISLVTPVITLQFIEGMFRFLFKVSDEDKKQTISTVTAFLCCGLVVLGGIVVIIHFVVPSVKYPFLIYLNYVSSVLLTYMQKLARCEQKNLQFAISGVLHTFVMLGCQVIALLVLHLGIDGMLAANCISYIAAAAYLEIYVRAEKKFSLKNINKTRFKELFRYSVPLVPNSVCWWLVSSSDRYIISFFLGTAASGIYSIAGKFSQLLTFATSVFQLAWQESAIMEEDSKGRDKFYSDTFNTYMKLLLGGYLVILPFIRIAMPVLVAGDYQQGYLYNPVLLLGAVFSAFSQFYGSAYLVFKKTGGAFTTTVIAAVINVLIGIVFIPYIGLYAPAIGTAVSFGVQWLVRMYQMRDYFRVKIEVKNMLILVLCVVLVTACYYTQSIGIHIVSFVFGAAVCLYMNKNMILSVFRKLKPQK